MRAGLLSEYRIIKLINDRFVPTWVLIDDLKPHTAAGNHFAQNLESNWEYPLDLMFLTSDGEFVSKLNSFRDLPAHPNVGHPHHALIGPDTPSKAAIFSAHAMDFLER
jgi:hypothetical protein